MTTLWPILGVLVAWAFAIAGIAYFIGGRGDDSDD